MDVFFEFFLDIGAGVGRFLGSFNLGDEVVLGELLCLTLTLIFDVYLLGVSCGVVVCFDISAKLTIAFNLLSRMDENGAVGAGFAIAFIKSSAALVDDS